MQRRRVNFHTLGCKLNFSESSTLAREFEAGGFIRVGVSEAADISVINSCSVTEHADKKCRNLIRKIHRRNPAAIIVVTGCYAQLKPQEIASIEGVDLVLSNNDKGELFRRVAALAGKGPAQFTSCDVEELTNFFAAFSSGDRTRAFLKVQDGCDYKCAYCTIHYARGASRNMPIADLVKEAEQIAAAGQREIVITGINTGDFGRTTGERFIDLLRALNEVEGIERYRISSIEPNLLTDEIIAFCASSPKFQHHFHIPLQSGSDSVLARMRRRYTTAKFAERIEAVRRLMPDAFIGIDVIVGFSPVRRRPISVRPTSSWSASHRPICIFSPSRSVPARRPSIFRTRYSLRWLHGVWRSWKSFAADCTANSAPGPKVRRTRCCSRARCGAG